MSKNEGAAGTSGTLSTGGTLPGTAASCCSCATVSTVDAGTTSGSVVLAGLLESTLPALSIICARQNSRHYSKQTSIQHDIGYLKFPKLTVMDGGAVIFFTARFPTVVLFFRGGNVTSSARDDAGLFTAPAERPLGIGTPEYP